MADEAPTAEPLLASDDTPATREMTTAAEKVQQRVSDGMSGDDGEQNDGSTTNTVNDVMPNTAATGAALDAGGGGATAAAAAAAATNGGEAGNGRPPRTQSVRQGRKEKRKAGWAAKKAWIKEKKREERERR